MTTTMQNTRSKYGDERCLKAYALYLQNAARPKRLPGSITGMSFVALTGRAIAQEMGLSDEQVRAA